MTGKPWCVSRRGLLPAALWVGLTAFGNASPSTPAAAASPASVEIVGTPAATETVEFELLFPLRDSTDLDQLLDAQSTPTSPEYEHYLTPSEFRARFGMTDETAASASRILAEAGLQVVARHAQGLRVRGTATAVDRVFGTKLAVVRTAQGRGTHLRSLEPPILPAALAALGARTPEIASFVPHIPMNRESPTGPYWFDDLKQAYSFPSFKTVTGKGRTIGIISVSDVNRKDLEIYFGHEKLAVPKVLVRNVIGGSPFDPNSGASKELNLDLQQTGGMAPNATLVVYNLPSNFDDAFIAGYLDMVEDNVVDIVSISWGNCEDFYSPAYSKVFGGAGYGILDAYSNLFRQGNAQGITFVNSSGDFGAFGCVSLNNITTPPKKPPRVVGKATVGPTTWAGDPHVTAVGGTNLVTTHKKGSKDSAYVRENAHSDPLIPFDPFGTGNLVANEVWGSGGGFSRHFRAPPYQDGVTGSRFRAFPDVSMHMGGCISLSELPCGPDRSSDVVIVGGKEIDLHGTSASAPDFAGVLALWEELEGGKRFGNVNPRLYARAAKNGAGHYFRQDIPGDNGFYKTHAGYNEVLGLGTPVVKNLLGIPNDPGAGIPQTPSNP